MKDDIAATVKLVLQLCSDLEFVSWTVQLQRGKKGATRRIINTSAMKRLNMISSSPSLAPKKLYGLSRRPRVCSQWQRGL